MAKNVSDVVLGMLSDTGSATRVPARIAPEPAPQPAAPAVRDPAPAAAVPAAAPAHRPAPAPGDTSEAPRTLRLRPEAATRLRASWLEAKRDDVLLTAQDFASDLVLEALVSRRRRRTQTPA